MKYIHLRNTKEKTAVIITKVDEIQPRGGETIGWYVKNEKLYVIRVKCNKLDNYSRIMGRDLVQLVSHEIETDPSLFRDVQFVRCSDVVIAFREHLKECHYSHDYNYPGLTFYNIPFSFINQYVIGMFK